MRKLSIRLILLPILILLIVLIGTLSFGSRRVSAQQPTVAIPTVTGTPEGPIARVNSDNEQINVRSGPKTTYEIVGVLVAGQKVPALGKSSEGAWIQIAYSGVSEGVAWVYSPYVTVTKGGELRIIEPPPPPTPRITRTIDPALASQLIIEIPATRMATFTAPPPLIIPTFEPPNQGLSTVNFPMGLVISIVGFLGIFVAIISLFRRR